MQNDAIFAECEYDVIKWSHSLSSPNIDVASMAAKGKDLKCKRNWLCVNWFGAPDTDKWGYWCSLIKKQKRFNATKCISSDMETETDDRHSWNFVFFYPQQELLVWDEKQN